MHPCTHTHYIQPCTSHMHAHIHFYIYIYTKLSDRINLENFDEFESKKLNFWLTFFRKKMNKINSKKGWKLVNENYFSSNF